MEKMRNTWTCSVEVNGEVMPKHRNFRFFNSLLIMFNLPQNTQLNMAQKNYVVYRVVWGKKERVTNVQDGSGLQ